MAQNSDIGSYSSALSTHWSEYNDWAAFSRKQKKTLKFWRKTVLSLGIGGAVFETLAVSNIGSLVDIGGANLFGVIGFIFLTLSAFFGRNVLGGGQEKDWVRSRSIAEKLKSEAYKYCMKVPPYHLENREQKLVYNKNGLTNSNGSIPVIPNASNKEKKSFPSENMDVSEYISTRIFDQIDPNKGYYWKAAKDNIKKVKRFKYAALCIGSISAVLGGFGALKAMNVAIWVAAFTTLSTSITAYFQASRYEYLVLSYSATARRIKNIYDSWTANPDFNDISKFVQACEDAISFENQAWLAEWLKPSKRIQPMMAQEMDQSDI